MIEYNTIEFTVPGRAIPKARPRVLKNGFTYTPKNTIDYEAKVADYFRSAYPDFPLITTPFRIVIQELRGMPTSWSAKKKNEFYGQPVGTRPDLDNICKSILDGLINVAVDDDCLCYSMELSKYYDYDSSVFVRIIYEDRKD